MNPIRVALRTAAALSCVGALSCSSAPKSPTRPYQRTGVRGFAPASIEAFGVKFLVRAWPAAKPGPVTPAQAVSLATAEIARIAKLADAAIAGSQVSQINDTAYKAPVPISPELYALLADCQRMYQLSDGKFDVTFVPVKYNLNDSFNEEDLNVVTDWDRQPPLTKKTARLFGQQNMLLDPEPPRARLFNRRTKVNLNGVIRGYAASRAAQLLAKQGLGGFSVMAEGFLAAGGSALNDPGLMCVENPAKLGTCLYRIQPTDLSKIIYIGSSASQERRGKIFDPKDTWIYRSGGVVVAGYDGAWVQFATTIAAVMDDGQLTSFFQKTQNLKLAGAYFNRDNNQLLEGSFAPLATALKLSAPARTAPGAAPGSSAKE
jgi:thiamine biosynthesis lipoprotein ApbE